MKPAAIIFDLDGTLIDNNHYHFLAWQAFYKNQGLELTHDYYKHEMSGKTNKDLFDKLFNTKLTPEASAAHANVKESLYRQLYEPHIAPITGLIEFLDSIKLAGIPMAVATSGIPVNIAFMFNKLPMLLNYFETVVDFTAVTHGKPHPEIYLTAAKRLGVEPTRCIAFEDAWAGIESAKDAGMKVVALTTTHPADELHSAHHVIKDYTQINLAIIQQLL
jgi:HAD superfamily hydrolase (TIGR01509 family)